VLSVCLSVCLCAGRDAGRTTSRRLSARQTQADAVSLQRRQPVRLHRGLQRRLAMQTERQLPGQAAALLAEDSANFVFASLV